MTAPEMLPLQASSHQVEVGLLGIGTANPPPLPQTQALPLAEGLSCDTDQHRSFMKRVFLRSGVDSRGTVLAKENGDLSNLLAFYPPRTSPDDLGPTTRTRMEKYAQEAPALAEHAVRNALHTTHISPQDITHLLTVSCTGFFAPGLDVALIQRLSLPPNIRRQHIGFMGCHAAFNALAAAHNIVRADPDALVLVCCIELCSLHFAYGFTPEKLVANALFADGAAAAVIGDATTSNAAPTWRLLDFAGTLLPNTLDAMTWRIKDHGFEMTLSPDLPAVIKSNLRPWVEEVLSAHHLAISDIAHWPIHPGGPKILAAAAESLSLPAHALQPSYDILSRHGNMSSATILFVLNHLASTTPTSCEAPTLALGFGPGLMMEAMLLNR